MTDAGEGAARTTLRQFEQIHAVFETLTGSAVQDGGKPFTIIAPRDEASMKRLLPAFWEVKGNVRPGGVFFDDPTQVFVVVRVGETPSFDRSHSTVFHEYVHFMIARLVERLPLWLNEGLAEFYATCSVESDRVIIGRAAPWDLERLAGTALIPMEAMLAVDSDSPLYNEKDRASIFYAQAWAVVHYLILGDKGVHGPRLAAYMKLVAGGADFVDAGRQAFGDLKSFAREIEIYVRGVQFFMKPVLTPSVPAEKSFQTRGLAPAETLAIVANLHAVTGRKTEARTEAEEAVRLDPALGLGWRALARVESDQGRLDEARKAAAEAVRLDPTSAVGHYLLGSVAWHADDLPAAETELARAVEIDDALAVAQVRLAVLRNGLGRPNDEVIPHVRRALALEPGNPQFLMMLSGVLADRGDAANARLLADRALQMARTAEERAHVQETRAEIERVSARRAAARAAVGPKASPDAAASPAVPADPGGPPRPQPASGTSAASHAVTDAQAFRMFRASCEAGEPRGCDAAGDALLVGRGVPRDLALAATLYAKGCEGGVARSCHQLAVLYATGQGVARDPAQARTLFQKACKGGHEPACAHAN